MKLIIKNNKMKILLSLALLFSVGFNLNADDATTNPNAKNGTNTEKTAESYFDVIAKFIKDNKLSVACGTALTLVAGYVIYQQFFAENSSVE